MDKWFFRHDMFLFRGCQKGFPFRRSDPQVPANFASPGRSPKNAKRSDPSDHVLGRKIDQSNELFKTEAQAMFRDENGIVSKQSRPLAYGPPGIAEIMVQLTSFVRLI
jgi:hypothetical protein